MCNMKAGLHVSTLLSHLQALVIVTYRFNRLVPVMKMHWVCCEVRNEFLYDIYKYSQSQLSHLLNNFTYMATHFDPKLGSSSGHNTRN
jgi:hypothetical protein